MKLQGRGLRYVTGYLIRTFLEAFLEVSEKFLRVSGIFLRLLESFRGATGD